MPVRRAERQLRVELEPGEKSFVVRHNDQSATILTQHVLKRSQCRQVEVIVGLVEQQQRGWMFGVQHECQRCLDPLAATEFCHGQVHTAGIEAEQGQAAAQASFCTAAIHCQQLRKN